MLKTPDVKKAGTPYYIICITLCCRLNVLIDFTERFMTCLTPLSSVYVGFMLMCLFRHIITLQREALKACRSAIFGLSSPQNRDARVQIVNIKIIVL